MTNIASSTDSNQNFQKIKNFLKKDSGLGIAITVLVGLLAFVILRTPFQGMERWAYDLGVRFSAPAPDPNIAVIAIDDNSIRNLGRWPWPRHLQADLIEKLKTGGAKAIASTVLYSEPQNDAGTQKLQELAQKYANAAKSGGDLGKLVKEIQEASAELDGDQVLARAMKDSAHVSQAMLMTLGVPQGNPDKPLPEALRQFRLSRHQGDASDANPMETLMIEPPVLPILQNSAAVGHLNFGLERDGVVRQEILVLKHFEDYFPSLALALAAQSWNIKPSQITLKFGEGVQVGKLTVPTSEDFQFYPAFYPDGEDSQGRPKSAFQTDSFYDVFSGNIPIKNYQNKIVIIGSTAAGVGDSLPTPISPNMSPALVLAHTTSAILNQHFYTHPAWTNLVSLLIFGLIGAYLAFILPKLSAMVGGVASFGIAIGFLVLHLILMKSAGLWLPLMIPASLAVIGWGAITLKSFNLTEKLKIGGEIENAESNKQLGLALQNTGQLDMALEKFRRVQPVTESVLELFYNLALDYERKRQFNKAANCYETIQKHKANFRDVAQKLARARAAENTVILGGGTSATSSLLLGGEQPMLGRYRVEKELGKGAMGVVYLGKDPRIGRTVAIKTLSLSTEFEADELADVKERFFREAETAGRLSHPHIVTIFDAGEEHDLAYIAMEFINGHDLNRYIKPDQLLPAREVFKLIIQAAEALDFAHSNGIVHRDIKPANLMYLTQEKIVKVADFGIARITDNSKTKTGLVLGTPSYMSPEQVAGKKVDGRSDIFSLGVTLYQLLSGKLPFQADNIAALMFKITNDNAPRITEIRADLPVEINGVLERALAKKMDERYQTGNEMARDLRHCMAKVV